VTALTHLSCSDSEMGGLLGEAAGQSSRETCCQIYWPHVLVVNKVNVPMEAPSHPHTFEALHNLWPEKPFHEDNFWIYSKRKLLALDNATVLCSYSSAGEENQ
jgi:hypothetical protein